MKSLVPMYLVFVIALLVTVSGPDTLIAQSPSVPFLVHNGGAVSETTSGTSTALSVGYARIRAGTGSRTPAGVAIFGFRQNDILVGEAGVPASPLISDGRIYAAIDGPVRTGLAIANPSELEAVVTFHFSDQTRMSFQAGTTTIRAGGQIAAFLDEEPFNGESPVVGTFTFSSTVPVAAVALRGFTNQRSEFLLTTLPVSTLAAAGDEVVYFPHFADGNGWTTEVVLVNPSDATISGTVQFFGQGETGAAALPITMTIQGQTASTFGYSIPGRSAQTLETPGTGSTIQVGSVRVTPATNTAAPSGLVVFSFRNATVRVAEAGVPASRTGQAFRLYAEATDPTAGSIQTGVAIVNPATAEIEVTFELLTRDGGSTRLNGSVTVPANGQIARFLNQIQGLESLATPFEGVLRISTNAPGGISVVGLRSRLNERGDFLITTTTIVDEAAPDVTDDLFFPHLADGDGYTTQFIQLSGSTDQTMVGTLDFVDQAGQALDLGLAISDASLVTWQHDGVQWSSSSPPPNCQDPLILPVPAALTEATSILYPGQLRGNEYKPHGGIRFDGPGQGHDVKIVAPMDGTLLRGSRHLEDGIVQHTFDFINACGIMHRLDHLLTLSPRFAALADSLPLGGEGQSQSTFFPPGLRVKAGESIATEIGLAPSNASDASNASNVFFDWGVYDLRSKNATSSDASWLASHPGELAPHAICWLEFLSPSDTLIVTGLPPADSVSGAVSDYCK